MTEFKVGDKVWWANYRPDGFSITPVGVLKDSTSQDYVTVQEYVGEEKVVWGDHLYRTYDEATQFLNDSYHTNSGGCWKQWVGSSLEIIFNHMENRFSRV